MRTEVRNLIDSLRADHRNMSLLLDLLSMETDRLAASADPDYDLVKDIMIYMTEYPDVIHHPTEDFVYRHLKSLRPGIDEDLDRVESDHSHIEKLGAEIKNDIEAIAGGSELDRDEIIEQLRQYIMQLLEHMYWEEQGLFKFADELECDDNWLAIVSKAEKVKDPLFGSEVARKYRRLFARIQQRVAWDSQRYLA